MMTDPAQIPSDKAEPLPDRIGRQFMWIMLLPAACARINKSA
jgi:hypothetical protein